MPGVGVVLNPKSRRNLRDPNAADRLARAVGDDGVVRCARTIDELYTIAEEFRRLDVEILAISGGDGTNQITLTGFLDVYGEAAIPPVALLRGGTMNTVANSVGVPRGTPGQILRRLLDGYALRGSTPLGRVERHLMRITPRAGGKARYGFLFGTGVVQGFLAEYYAGGDPSPLLAATTLGRGIASALVGGDTIRRVARPFRGSVVFERGQTWEERDYLSIAAGTIAHIGLGFRPFHRFDECPGCFHLLGIHASPVGFVRELWRIHGAKPMSPGKARDEVSSKAVVRSADGAVRYMVDGDLHETPGEIELSSGPAVKLIVPS